MTLSIGTIVSSRYEIIKKIGSGGMSIVYKAKDLKLDRFVTFKVLREEYINDEEFIKRFSIEARAAAKLNNINIVNVYDVGNEDNIYYIVIEYIDGTTLKEIIDRKKNFSTEEIIGISMQIAKGLKHAHDNGIIHRDIKPENILITKKGVVKVTDFGIARAADTSTVDVDSTMGSVYYFSPEQARGGFVDHKSDIYSLGIVMFELATGNPPFDGDTAVTIALKHLNSEVPDVMTINQNISKALGKIINKATQKKSINRYENINALIEDLKRAIAVITEKKPQTFETDIKIDDDRIIKSGPLGPDLPEPPKVDNTNRFKVALIRAISAGIITSLLIIGFIFAIQLKQIDAAKTKYYDKPKLTDISFDEAKSIISKYGLTYIDTYKFDDNIPSGNVISADFGNLDKIYEGCKVYLVISSGKQQVSVPNFIGKNIEEVKTSLSNGNYDIEYAGKDEYINHDIVLENNIISQDPLPDSIVPKGTTITFKVSLGKKPKYVTIPSFIGLTEKEAKALADESKLVLNIVYSTSNEVKKGLVINQTTREGKEVPENYNLSIIVSSGNAPVKTQTAESTSQSSSSTLKKKTLTIDLSLSEGVESVTVKVYGINSEQGTAKVEMEKVVSKSDFPLKVPVYGKGTMTYEVWMIENGTEKIVANNVINFDE